MTSTGGMEIDGYSNLVKIAKGGFGTVFRGTQDRFGREVALKVLDTEDLDEKGRRRFERECLAMGSLSWHPGVVAVFDSGITDARQPYLAMEYLDAGSLGDRLKNGPMGWPEALRVGVQVAGALEAAHRAGTLHRDLKPENILIGPFGEAKLADFGIAAIQGSTRTTVGHASFTVAHVAPEVLRGHRPDERSDVYGLATTLHTLVAGAPPFAGDPGEPFVATMARIVNEPPPRMEGVPAPFADLLQRALAKDPDRRPRTALEFGESLQGVQASAGGPVTELQVARTSAQGARHLSARGVGDPDATPVQPRTGDARPTVHVPVGRIPEGHGVVETVDAPATADKPSAESEAGSLGISSTTAQATAAPVGASARGVVPAWWLPGLVGVAVIAGALLPFVSMGGSTSRLAEPSESVASYVALGALLVLASAVGRGSRLGMALAGGAGLTFLASYAGVLRSTLSIFDGAGALGIEAVPHVGFFLWGAAAIGSAAVVILALTSLGGPTARRWPFVLGVVGFALLLAGLVVPRAGLDVGEHLFSGDGWSDAAVVLMLASLALVAVMLAVRPTSSVAAFAVGAGCPWFVSWVVFAFTGAPGGLPVPFPEAAFVAGLAFGLMSATLAGALWWSPSALAPTAGATLAGARVAVIVLCGATCAVAVGGTAAADRAESDDLVASNVAPSLDNVVVTSDAGTSGEVTAPNDPDPEGVVPSTTSALVPTTTTETATAVARCVEVFCRPHPELSQVVDELIDESGSRELALSGEGQWIAQVQANAVTSSDAQLREAYASLSAQVRDLRVVYSDDFASMPSGYVIFFNAGPFSSGEDAVSYCFDLGRGDSNLCFGRFMSDDPADSEAYVFP